MTSAETPSKPACRICGNEDGNTPWRVREMMYGTREVFDYFQCGKCGCLQIAPIPSDLGRYYPADYYSYRKFDRLPGNRLRRFIDRRRVRQSFGKFSFIGWLANKVGRPLDYLGWARRAGLGLDARVLDVGCGNGKNLLRMKLGGFAQCTGVDPFIRETLHYPNGVTIHKQDLDTFSRGAGPFDFIMFHHSLEHVPDPLGDLRTAARLLSDGGRVLVSIPVADSYAWEHYRENWYNLDAPRHLYLLTNDSMSRLAEKAGLVIEDKVSVSLSQQFSESERYKRDIAGNSPVKAADFLDERQMAEFRRQTEQLNLEGRGDHRMFYLRRAN